MTRGEKNHKKKTSGVSETKLVSNQREMTGESHSVAVRALVAILSLEKNYKVEIARVARTVVGRKRVMGRHHGDIGSQ